MFLAYLKAEDFPGADMARKFFQMGWTRHRELVGQVRQQPSPCCVSERAAVNESTKSQQSLPPPSPPSFKVVGLAASAGGVEAVSRILAALPGDFPAAIVLVQHRTAQEPFLLPKVLSRQTALRVEKAVEGTALRPATAFVAPPDWHLLVNEGGILSPSRSPKVHSVRPSADVLFVSLATSFKERAVAVVLTGAGSDGSGGLPVIKRLGGVVIVQDAATAEVSGMPRSAIETGVVDFIAPLDEIASTLVSLVSKAKRNGLPDHE
jgi:two-component system chemotaxis response regulator CheB